MKLMCPHRIMLNVRAGMGYTNLKLEMCPINCIELVIISMALEKYYNSNTFWYFKIEM